MSEHPQLLLFADVVPNGNGGFIVQPRKPLGPEITTKQAARILGVCRAQMWYLRNCHPQAQKILKWRFTSEKAVRGARPSCLVKMSNIHARQTSVVNSVIVPGGKSLRSSSRFLVVAMRAI